MKLKSKNQKIELRHMRIEDAKGYFNCQQDKESKKGFMSVPKTIEQAKDEVRQKIEQYGKKKPSNECFAIIINGEFAGYVEINELYQRWKEHKGNIGYCVDKKFRGRGIATKAVKIITNYAFKKYKLKRMTGWCRTFNKASARVLEKAGYKLEGILRKNKFKDGKYLDDMIWARIR